jgi:PhzF family phenazine biosynthesis protein
MQIPLYQVDAFSSRVFGGNPAAVCPLEDWLDDATLQSIALENNLSETAFFRGSGERRELRWFTPACEVDLCGHATLGSAFVIMQLLEKGRRTIRFETRSGELTVTSDGRLYTLDFPSRPPTPLDPPPPALAGALGATPLAVLSARDVLAVLGSEAEVKALEPDMGALAKLDTFAVIATAPGSDVDFVSRFFAPAKGVPEDPVTGSAHCTLIPYWAQRLGKTKLRARQVSKRGGELWCELDGDRVKISGEAVLYAEGKVYV